MYRFEGGNRRRGIEIVEARYRTADRMEEGREKEEKEKLKQRNIVIDFLDDRHMESGKLREREGGEIRKVGSGRKKTF